MPNTVESLTWSWAVAKLVWDGFNPELVNLVKRELWPSIQNVEVFEVLEKSFFPDSSNSLSKINWTFEFEWVKYPIINWQILLWDTVRWWFGFSNYYSPNPNQSLWERIRQLEWDWLLKPTDVYYSAKCDVFCFKNTIRGFPIYSIHRTNLNYDFMMPWDKLFNYWKVGNTEDNLEPESPVLLRYIESLNDDINYLIFTEWMEYDIKELEQLEKDEAWYWAMWVQLSWDYRPEEIQFTESDVYEIEKKFYDLSWFEFLKNIA